jgi:hypothetical protein
MLHFNNDTTPGNYLYQYHSFAGGQAGAQGNNSILFRFTTAADAGSNYFYACRVLIDNYTSSYYKVALGRSGGQAGSPRSEISQVTWENTDAINRITISPDGYSTDKYVADSRLIIYGIKEVS